jgi:hypothetical protein
VFVYVHDGCFKVGGVSIFTLACLLRTYPITFSCALVSDTYAVKISCEAGLAITFEIYIRSPIRSRPLCFPVHTNPSRRDVHSHT